MPNRQRLGITTKYIDISEQPDRGLQSLILYLALLAMRVFLSSSAQVAFLSTSIYKEKGMSLQTIKTRLPRRKCVALNAKSRTEV